MSPTVFVLAQSTLGFWEKLTDPFVGAGFLVNFLVLGSLYSLLAVGFVIVFKATQVLNFAHGAVAALGAYFTWSVVIKWEIPVRWFPEGSAFSTKNTESILQPYLLTWVVGLILAVAVAALLGLVLERLFVEPMVGEPLFSVAIITLGMDIFLRTMYNDVIGVRSKPMGDPFGFNSWKLPVGDQTMLLFWAQPFIIVVGIIVAILLVWFFRSKYGVAMRATAFDQEAAMAQGIPVSRIFALAWIIGGGLAALAGTFFAMSPPGFTGAHLFLPFIAFRALPAVVVGGLDSVPGAVVGGMIVAFIEIFLGTYFGFLSDWVGNGFGEIIPYVVMFVFLLVKPYGLFGTEEIRRV